VNKKLFAFCVGALSTSAAFAQTSVVLYGIGDGDFRIDHTSIGTLKSVGSGGESGSRWGIRGTEDLGSGLKAVFTFEQGFDLSDNSVPQGVVGGTTPNSPTSTPGSSRLFSRTAQVGLSSAQLGDVLVGRAYTPFYATWISIDPMGGGFVGGAQNFAVGSVTRFDNAIYYNSPKLYGFQVTSAYRLGESDTDSVASGSVKNGGNAGNASLTYAAGPLLAAYSFMSTKSSLDNNTTRTQFGGAVYDLKFLKVHAMYFNTRNATTRLQSYALGVTVPVGAFNFFTQVARIDNRFDLNGSQLKNNDANFIGLGAQYVLSKRTDIYTSWAKQVNQAGAVNTVTDASNAGLFTTTGALANQLPGFDPWSAQIGIRHRF
jgi:general bacterial porin, GBP family